MKYSDFVSRTWNDELLVSSEASLMGPASVDEGDVTSFAF